MPDAGIQATEANAERIGVNIGSGIGGLPMIEEGARTLSEQGPRRISPFFIPGTIINMISGNVSIMYGFKGPEPGDHYGVHHLDALRGRVGAADRLWRCRCHGRGWLGIHRLPAGDRAASRSARALSTRNDDPATASRPWDKGRDGFVLGEGAGVLVLEEMEHAKARGAKIYAELVGYGMSADAHHVTAPCADGDGARRCMVNALKDAHANPEDVDYINAHGTSTPLGDKSETIAVKRCFGDHAAKLALSSTKSMTGHLLGAAGGVEAVFTVLGIQQQIAPPTINLHEPDPDCDLDYVPNQAREMRIRLALSNSFGFGGTNGTLAFGPV